MKNRLIPYTLVKINYSTFFETGVRFELTCCFTKTDLQSVAFDHSASRSYLCSLQESNPPTLF